jgi:hypothetical protein
LIGSNVLEMSSVKAHGHTGSPPSLGHPWQKRHMRVHKAKSKHVGTPPSVGVPTAKQLVGTITVRANILVVKPAYHK